MGNRVHDLLTLLVRKPKKEAPNPGDSLHRGDVLAWGSLLSLFIHVLCSLALLASGSLSEGLALKPRGEEFGQTGGVGLAAL